MNQFKNGLIDILIWTISTEKVDHLPVAALVEDAVGVVNGTGWIWRAAGSDANGIGNVFDNAT